MRHHFDFRGTDLNSVNRLFDASFCSISMKHGFSTEDAPWGISRFDGIKLHDVGVVFDEGFGRRSVTRTRADIVKDAKSDFIVVIPLQRHSTMQQFGISKDCGPGYFRVLSTAIPFAGYVAVTGTRDRYAEMLATIPGAMLREIAPRIDEMSNIPLALRSGAGNLMKSFFELALAEGRSLSGSQARDFSATLARAVATAVMESPEYAGLEPSGKSYLHRRVPYDARDFILRNLADSTLDSKKVADHCQVSLRYLQKIFPGKASVAEFIRESRLQKCRADLRNPALSSRTATEISARWGFGCSSSFSRIYRAQFGVSPGRDRNTPA